jgi:hypothetical protein
VDPARSGRQAVLIRLERDGLVANLNRPGGNVTGVELRVCDVDDDLPIVYG